MSKRIIAAAAGVLALSALVCAMIVITKSRVQERSAEAVKVKSGWYMGSSIDQGIKSIGINAITQTFTLQFTQPYDSYYCSGRYAIEGDRLKATDRATGDVRCTFKIEKDGSLVLLEDESPYFQRKPSPFYADFEDGAVFRFANKLDNPAITF